MGEGPSAEGSVQIPRRLFVGMAAGTITAGAIGIGVWAATRDRLADRLVSHRRPDPLPVEDPGAEAWSEVAPFEVRLQPQRITPPTLAEPSIASVLVRSLHDGSWIAFHLEWGDETKDELETMARFRDAVAVQLPAAPGAPPSVTMGAPDSPVHILHWKASWQADVDTGRKSVKDAFPNAFNDVVPEGLMGDEAARVFYPGIQVGNPLSQLERGTPVEELVAEGFGSLTTQEEQRAVGRGIFADGRWRVVIAVPMQGGEAQATLEPGGRTSVAFAVWNGGAGNRGARKHWGDWTPIEIEGAG
jgi:hypothetical protein